MARVFISYSHEDSAFVEFLVEVLKHHYLDVWTYETNIRAGEKYREMIDHALAQADALLVIVSSGSVGAPWITKEVTSYIERNPDGKVIPLLMEDIDPKTVCEGLQDYQAISFRNDLLSAFRALLGTFGKKFCARTERRQTQDRRVGERRSGRDRRTAHIAQRIAVGFWKCYESATSSSKLDTLALTPSNRVKMASILTKEAGKYRYFQGAEEVEVTASELEALADAVWKEIGSWGSARVSLVIEMLAEKLTQSYDMQFRDRRPKGNDRRSDADRRQ